MSTQLLVYSRAPLQPLHLASACQSPTLPEHLLWELRFLDDHVVVGWHPGAADAADVGRALKAKDTARLEALMADEVIASIQLSTMTADAPEWNDMMEDVRQSMDQPEILAYLHTVSVLYVLETSENRNELSGQMQEALWYMVGILTTGLIFDPQEGRFELCAV